MTEITFKEYFDSLLERSELLGLKCRECGAFTCPPKSTCDGCGSRDVKKTILGGKGKIRTFTTVYISPRGYEDEAPYVTALAELEEGPWLIGRIDMEEEEAEEIGQDLIGREISVFGKKFPSEDFYPDKEMRVVPMFKLE